MVYKTSTVILFALAAICIKYTIPQVKTGRYMLVASKWTIMASCREELQAPFRTYVS